MLSVGLREVGGLGLDAASGPQLLVQFRGAAAISFHARVPRLVLVLVMRLACGAVLALKKGGGAKNVDYYRIPDSIPSSLPRFSSSARLLA